MQDSDDDDWFPLDIHEAFKEMRERKIFDVSDMYTIADVWGWTWEKELKNKPPRSWTQEWEVELAIKVMLKACSRILCLLPTAFLILVLFHIIHHLYELLLVQLVCLVCIILFSPSLWFLGIAYA